MLRLSVAARKDGSENVGYLMQSRLGAGGVDYGCVPKLAGEVGKYELGRVARRVKWEVEVGGKLGASG